MKPQLRGGNGGSAEKAPLVEVEIEIGGESEAPEMEQAAPVGYKKGGRIDGCAIKGHTKGTVR